MLDADEEEWWVYKNVEKGYLNYTPRSNYESWARTHPKDRKFYTVLARGLTQRQAKVMIDLARGD